MAEQTQTQSTASRSDECDAIEDLDPLPPYSFYDKVYEVAERFSSTRLGQFVCERADRVLKIVEDTAKWSLPQDTMEMKLERPMSWPLFLAMIIMLRLIRLWLSVAALMIGNDPVTAHDVVIFMQTRRRKLRALRMIGVKAMHSRAAQLKSGGGGDGDGGCSGTAIGVMAKLGGWFSSAICRPGQQGRVFICRGRQELPTDKADTTTAAERPTTKRRRDEECAQDLNLSCNQMLSKYAEEDSDDDSDFIPPPNELDESSNSSGGDSDSCSNDEYEEREDAVASETSNEQSQTTNGEPTNDSGNRNDSVELATGRGHSKHIMPKPLLEIKNEPLTDNDSGSEQLSTPKELNGPSNGDARMGVAEADVAKTGTGTGTEKGTVEGAATAAPAHQQHNNLLFANGCNSDEQRKSTPGHESAARMAVVMPALGSAATAATPTRTIGKLPLSSSRSRSNASSPETSFSSLDSHVPSDDELLFIGLEQCARMSRASKRTTTLNSSTSSSEDIFFSPIGSPTDFNSCIRPVSILKKYPPRVPPLASEAQSMHKAVDEQNSASEYPVASEMPKKHVHHQPTSTTAKQNQSQNQYQNRYRGKNRR